MPIWSVGVVADFAKSAYIPTMRAFHNDVARIMPFVGIRNPGDVLMQIRASVAASPAWHGEGAAPVPTDPTLASIPYYFQRLSHQFLLDFWSERAKNDPN